MVSMRKLLLHATKCYFAPNFAIENLRKKGSEIFLPFYNLE